MRFLDKDPSAVVAELRSRLGRTQAEMAKDLGVAVQTYRRYERPGGVPTKDPTSLARLILAAGRFQHDDIVLALARLFEQSESEEIAAARRLIREARAGAPAEDPVLEHYQIEFLDAMREFAGNGDREDMAAILRLAARVSVGEPANLG